MTKIVLASNSPRRKALLEQIGLEFLIHTTVTKELEDYSISPMEFARKNAEIKATATCNHLKENVLVIGADTIVALNNHILLKPKNDQDAYRMISLLAGKKHNVYTGVCCILKNNNKIQKKTFVEKTDVFFRNLSKKDIENYVLSQEGRDKAGAYGIQGIGCLLIDHIEGDYNNVVGLPVARLFTELKLLIDVSKYLNWTKLNNNTHTKEN